MSDAEAEAAFTEYMRRNFPGVNVAPEAGGPPVAPPPRAAAETSPTPPRAAFPDLRQGARADPDDAGMAEADRYIARHFPATRRG